LDNTARDRDRIDAATEISFWAPMISRRDMRACGAFCRWIAQV